MTMTLREKRYFKKTKNLITKYYTTENKLERVLIAMSLNNLKSEVADLYLRSKISDDFFKTYFFNKKESISIRWWELNKDLFLS
jgi:hypothetical protein